MRKVGLSACFFHADPKRPIFKGKTLLYAEEMMLTWLHSKDLLPVMIPRSHRLEEVVNELEGLILQGGSDMSPASYGEKPLKPEWAGDRERDEYEIALIKTFVSKKKPVLGICRGAQVVNVAFGGTLFQDIQTQVPNAFEHRNWDVYDANEHEVRFEEGSYLRDLYSTDGGKVNSVHHQSIKDLGSGLIVDARSSDGIIEAIHSEGDSYVSAIQWHPEFQTKKTTHLLSAEVILDDFIQHLPRTESTQ